MATDRFYRSSLSDPRLVRHATGWERELWVLHDPRAGMLERGILVGFTIVLALLVGRLANLGQTEPEHFLVLGLVGLVMVGGVVASYAGRHVVLKVSARGLEVDHLEGLLPEDADVEQIWTWPTTWSSSIPWRRVHAVRRAADGELRLVLTDRAEWVVGSLRDSTLETMMPAIEQAIRMWGAHRQRPDGALADLRALRGQASQESA